VCVKFGGILFSHVFHVSSTLSLAIVRRNIGNVYSNFEDFRLSEVTSINITL